MIGIGHTAFGSILAVGVINLAHQQPVGNWEIPLVVIGSFITGLVSHYILDIVPHGHYEINLGSLNSSQKLIVALDVVAPLAVIGL